MLFRRPWLQQLDNAVVYGLGLGVVTIPVLLLISSYDEAGFRTWGGLILGVGSAGMTIAGTLAYYFTSPGKALDLPDRSWLPIERVALLSIAVPPIALGLASLPFAVFIIIGFGIALMVGMTFMPWSIVTTTAWTFVFIALTRPRDTRRADWGRGTDLLLLPLMIVFAVVLVPASWIVVDRALDDGTRPVDIVIEQAQSDTGRTHRWRLEVPPGFVPPATPRHPKLSRWYGGGGRRDIDYLHLEIGSATPPVPMTEHERWDGRLMHERASWILNLTLGGAYRGHPDQRAVEAFTRLEQSCRRSAATDGLVRYERSDARSCLWWGGDRKVFAAGSAPGRYELIITCQDGQFSPSAIAAGYTFPNTCFVDDLSINGWRVSLRFNERHLSNWRQVIGQAVDFLNAHTVESTTGRPGTNLRWIKGDGR